MKTMPTTALTCVDHCSDFVFDPVKWPRVQMEEDFLKLSQTFNATRSVVRVPALDPKYKIAVLASKQVCIIITLVMLHIHIHRWKQIPLRSIEFNSRVEMV
jgi:hypothetical protein